MTDKKPDIIDIDVVAMDSSRLTPNRAGDMALRVLATGLAQAAAEHQNLEELRAAEEARIYRSYPDTVRGRFESKLAFEQYLQDVWYPAVEQAQQATINRAGQQGALIHETVMRIARTEADALVRDHELDINEPIRKKEAEVALGSAQLAAAIQSVHDSQILKVEEARADIRIRELEAEGKIINERERIRIEAEERVAAGKREDARVSQAINLIRQLPQIRADIDLIKAEAPEDVARAIVPMFMQMMTNVEEFQNAPDDMRPVLAQTLIPMLEKVVFRILDYKLTSA